MQRILGVVLGLLLVVGAAACGDDDDDATGGTAPPGDAPASENVLSITEREYEFAVSGDVSAGTLSVAVSNEGAEFHEIAMGRLVDGSTVDDVRAALEGAGEDEEPDFEGILDEDSRIDDLGGVQLPGTGYTITGSEIPAGDYVLMCFIPSAEGVPHWSLGMLTDFTIGEGDPAAGPEADVTFTVTDEALDGPESVPAGETVIEVVNESSTAREVILMKLKEGATPEEVGAWFESAGDGAPDPDTAPLDFLAFVFDAEQDRSLTVTLDPGQWFIGTGDPENPFEGPPTEDPHAILITVT